MKAKNIIFIRSNPVNPDSRVEKEVNSLLKHYPDSITILAWDRSSNYKKREEYLKLENGCAMIHRFGIQASFGDGLKNLIPFIKFQLSVFLWLMKERKNYSLIHACDFDTGFIAMISTFLTKKKLIFDIFDYLSTDATTPVKKLIRWLENAVIKRSILTIICTEQREQQIFGSKPNELLVIHNSPYVIKNTSANSKKSSRFKIAYVGILQDHRLLLEMADIIKNREDCELHIGGFGKYEEYFEKLSSEYDNIQYYGKISYQQVLALEDKCDIITAIYDPVIGNHYYAAPNKFYEALMLGKPLIMVENTGMSDEVRENKIGVLIEFSKDGFEKGLNEIFSQVDNWASMSEKMTNLYEEKYSWSKMESRLLNAYEGLIGK